MALSSALAPGFIRLRYSGVNRPHNQTIPIKFDGVPTPGVDPALETSSGGSVLFSAGVVNYVDNVLAKSFSAATQFGFADIYAVDPVTGVRSFIFSQALNEVGDSVNVQVAKVEGIFLYKTTVGKFLKVYVMEGVYDPDLRDIGSVPADGRLDMNNYILGATNIFYGRGNSYPQTFISFTSKVNDVLRRNQLPTV